MRKLLALLVLLVATTVSAKPLTFITLTGAGSLSDTAIRQAAPAIEKHTGRQVVVINMPGANGLIGVRYFLSKTADDSTLLVGNSAIGYLLETNQISQAPKPVVGLAKSEMAVYTHANISSLQELIRTPDLKAGSTSPMTSLSLSMFDNTYGTNTTVVGYKQFSQAIVDLAAQRIEYLLAPSGVSAVDAVVSTGKIHKVASIGSQFTWNAIFYHPTVNNEILTNQLAKAIRETNFQGVQPFEATASNILHIQNSETILIKRSISK